ncbi:MAG TPA: NADH-quinone oxidoreductase subunit C, partial [Planctomycetota bacterium]|nr:NADH-quinone oxidoreductase subunit C [Planctomycetota bacterium]
DGTCCVEVAVADLRATLERIKSRAGFDTATFVTAVDHSRSKGHAGPRFRVVHQLLSVEHNDRVRVETPSDAEFPRVPTCTDLWPGVAYLERECFDMFGVVFEGHAGLKRLLMPEEYEHHPLRKEFPHQGIEPDKLYRKWDAERRAEERALEERGA